MDFFHEKHKPLILAKWTPKCTAERELGIRVDLQATLTDEFMTDAPPIIQRHYDFVKNVENATDKNDVTKVFENMTIEFYKSPDHHKPSATFVGVTLENIKIERPVAADGSGAEVYLYFSFNMRNVTDEQVVWAHRANRDTVFAKISDNQQKLFDGKAAAAGEDK